MITKKKRPEDENSARHETGHNVTSDWKFWPDKILADTLPDYPADAIKAANSIDATLNSAWTLSNPNNANVTPQEYAGGIVKKKDGSYISVHQKEGHEGDSKPKVRKKDMEEGDVAAGDYHTHPWSPADIADMSGTGYNWDGQGQGPSGADFISLAHQKLTDGHFSIIESGNLRSIIVVTDAKAYKAAFLKQNGPVTFEMTATIEEFINKAIGDPMNMENNPNASNPLSYSEAYFLGLVNGLKEVQRQFGGNDIGMKLLRSKPGKKSEYDTIFP